MCQIGTQEGFFFSLYFWQVFIHRVPEGNNKKILNVAFRIFNADWVSQKDAPRNRFLNE